MKRLLIAALTLWVAAVSLGASAEAETIKWRMKNEHPNILSVKFFSDDTNSVWPGNETVYVLDDGRVTTMTLNCQRGESICYGAWVKGRSSTYWGVGPDGDNGCNKCCYVCSGKQTPVISLKP